MPKSVYLLPGRNNYLENLAFFIRPHGFSVEGRDNAPPFSELRFSDQIKIISHELEPFWHQDARLIGRSNGAYLLLNVLLEKNTPYPGRVLLLSPVIGVDKNKPNGVYPPRVKLFTESVAAGLFPKPRQLEIHTGAFDDQCAPTLACDFSKSVNAKFCIYEEGHEFSAPTLEKIISGFLESDL